MSNSRDRDNRSDSSELERGMHGMTMAGGTVRVGTDFQVVQDQIQVQ